MSVTIVGTSAANGYTSAPVLSVPAGVGPGDLLIAVLNAHGTNQTLTAAPAGWTLLSGHPPAMSGSPYTFGNVRWHVYTRVVDGSEASSYTWTYNAPQHLYAQMIAVRTEDLDVQVLSSGVVTAKNVTAITAPALTGVAGGTVLTAYGARNATNGGQDFTPAAEHTVVYEGYGDFGGNLIVTEDIASAGAITPRSVTYSRASDMAATSIMIAAPTPPMARLDAAGDMRLTPRKALTPVLDLKSAGDMSLAAQAALTPEGTLNAAAGLSATMERLRIVSRSADFFDDFASPGLDRAKWPDISGTITMDGGMLNLRPISAYTSISSAYWFDLRNSTYTIEAVRANLGGTGQSIMTVRTYWGNTLQFIVTDGTMILRMTHGTTVTETQVPYDAGAHRWWRIRATGNKVFWQTSGDGRAWATRRTETLPFGVSHTRLALDAGSYGSPAATTTFQVRYVNLSRPWSWGQYAIDEDFGAYPSMIVDSGWYFGQWYLPPASAPYGTIQIAERTHGRGRVLRFEQGGTDFGRLRSWRQKVRDVDFSCDLLIHERTNTTPQEWHSPRMLWRVVDGSETYYQVQFGISFWEIGRFNNGTYTKLGEGQFGAVPGMSYRMRIVHHRDTIVLYRSAGDSTGEFPLESEPLIEMGRIIDNSPDAIDELGWVGFSGYGVNFDVSTIRVRPSSAPPGIQPSFPIRQRRWGSFASGSPADGGEAFKDLMVLVGKNFDVASWFQSWDEPWYADAALEMSSNGQREVLIAWEPFNRKTQDIIDGVYDADIDTFATAIASHPGIVWLRPFHEMNGDWYPWSATYRATYAGYEWTDNETQSPQHLAQAWRHVVDRFRALGVGNVRWVFNINAEDVPWDAPFEAYYPGSEYVDAVGIDGYNFGDSAEEYWNWVTFEQIMTQPYNRLQELAPDKEVWVCEFASKEPTKDDGAPIDPAHSKAEWVREVMESTNFRALTTLVWFNENKERDWRMDSSPAVLDVFQEQFALAAQGFQPPALDPESQPLPLLPSRVLETDIDLEYMYLEEDQYQRLNLVPSYGGIWVTAFDPGYAAPRDVAQNRADNSGTFDTTRLHGAKAAELEVTLVPYLNASVTYMRDLLVRWMDASRRPVLVYKMKGQEERRLQMRASQFSAPLTTDSRDTITLQMQWVVPDGTESARTVSRVGVDTGDLLEVVTYGTAPASPVFRVWGPDSNFRIVNESLDAYGTPARLAVNAALAFGQFIEIDVLNRTVALNGWSDPAASRRNLLTERRWFTLNPFRNLIRFETDGTDGYLEVFWRDTYR